MKHIFILLLFTAIATVGFSQTACQNFEKAKQIKAKADLKHHGTLKQIVLYWSKRCACESGAITGGTWDYTVEVANRVYDNYQNGNVTKDYTGPSFPVPDRRLSVGDCNNNSTRTSPSANFDCSGNSFDKSRDPQQYANAYMLARCECKNGVSTEERARQLEAQMKINYQNCQTYYGSTLGMPAPLRWSECKIMSLGAGQNNNSTPALIYTGQESNLQQLKDEYIATFSSGNTYNAYVAGENIKRLGVSMAKNFSNKLKTIENLIETTDPKALQKDYMDKMRNIETLEAQFKAESNSYFFQSGQQLGNSIGNGDYESAMFQAAGLLNAHLERKKAEREMTKKKAALEMAKNVKMRELYEKAEDFNEQSRSRFLLLAANSEDPIKEKYYLGMVENIDCYQQSMLTGYLRDEPNWLNNNCPLPTLQEVSAIENKFIPEDVKLSKIAEHKYKVFIEEGYNEFRDAAISFASSACSKKPVAKYFNQIAKYYNSYSSVLELTNYLAAAQTDPNFYSQEEKNKIEALKVLVKQEIQYALETNDVKFIESFVRTGLDKVIYIENQSLFAYTISIDQPEALQTILNEKIEDKSEEEVLEILHSTIMLCATNNAGKCIDKFIALGVPIDFVYKGKHPIEVAEETLSEDAFNILLHSSVKAAFYTEKYKNSSIQILLTSSDSPVLASKKLESIFNTDDFSRVIDRMITQLHVKQHFFITMGSSKITLNYLHHNSEVSKRIHAKLRESIFLPFYKSNAHLFFEHNLVSFDNIPTLTDIGFSSPVSIESIDAKNSVASEYVNGHQYVYFTPTFLQEHYDLTTDLGYISFTRHNPLLFHAIDKKYDLNTSKGAYNQPLFLRILNSGSFQDIYQFDNYYLIDYADSIPKVDQNYNHMIESNEYVMHQNPHTNLYMSKMQKKQLVSLLNDEVKLMNQMLTYRHYFYSSDFDFSKKINGEYPLFILLDSALVKSDKLLGISNNVLLYELYEILLRYNFDRNIQDGNGETLLHWLVRHVLSYVRVNQSATMKVLKPNYPSPRFINNLNIDTKIENKNGETAYQLFKLRSGIVPDDCSLCSSVGTIFEGELDVKSNKVFFFQDYSYGTYSYTTKEWFKEILK